jgi:hypothetical protein
MVGYRVMKATSIARDNRILGKTLRKLKLEFYKRGNASVVRAELRQRWTAVHTKSSTALEEGCTQQVVPVFPACQDQPWNHHFISYG